MFDRLDLTGVGLLSPGLTWEVIRRLKDTMKMKLVLKGIETREDAEQGRVSTRDSEMYASYGRRQRRSASTAPLAPRPVSHVGWRGFPA
jgi:isopentenyl diphosphate isomerase/L-lactate dehydrogenase-like FMN-dependent dehydrogenase